MFEDQTFDEVMERMLDRVPADIDKRENSVIWNALAPAAAELAQSYIWLDTVLELVFADTAQGEFLDRRPLKPAWKGSQQQKRSGPQNLQRALTFP